MKENIVTIREATLDDIETITDLAEKTWWPTYSPILEQGYLQYLRFRQIPYRWCVNFKEIGQESRIWPWQSN